MDPLEPADIPAPSGMMGAPTEERPTSVPRWLRSAVRGLEESESADRVAASLQPVASPLSRGGVGRVLHGHWLGHALHPLLTDLPLGCFLGAGLVDLFVGREGRSAAQRLTGLGLAAAVPTAAAGFADWAQVEDPRVRRVGAAHAVGNTLMLAAYGASWVKRRQGAHGRGVMLGLAGGALGWMSGYLGGHLSLNLASGVGDRGIRTSH